MSDTRLDRLGTRQHGLVTKAQLVEAGLSYRQIEHRLAGGELLAVRRGVYRLAGSRPTWAQCLLAVVLCGPDGTVASHLAAARLWALRGLHFDGLEVTSPGRLRLSGVNVHDRLAVARPDVARRDGIPVTSLARTFCDLSGRVPTSLLGRALDESLRSDQITLAAVEDCVVRQTAARRHGLGPIRALLDERSSGPSLGESALETKILGWIREAGLPDPMVQYRVRLAGRRRRFDAAYPDLQIAMEFHGWHEHGKRSAFEPDLTRRNDIELAGWLLLEFADGHTKSEVVQTVRAARAAQADRLSLPRCSPSCA